MELLMSKIRCGDVDIATAIGFMMFQSSCVFKILKHMAITKENSSPEFKKSSQLEIESN